MNIIDFLLILIAAISIAFAVYRGFLASLLALAACFVSLLCASVFGPRMAASLARNQGLTSMLVTFTDADSLIGDSTLADTPVVILNDETLDSILRSVPLPPVVQTLLRENIRTQAFQDDGVQLINGYISATVISVLLHTGSFLLCFLLCFLIMHVLISLAAHVLRFPVLRHLESPMAALMGLLRACVVIYVLLIVVPLIRTVIPIESVQQYIGESRLLPLFPSESLLIRVLGAR